MQQTNNGPTRHAPSFREAQGFSFAWLSYTMVTGKGYLGKGKVLYHLFALVTREGLQAEFNVKAD